MFGTADTRHDTSPRRGDDLAGASAARPGNRPLYWARALAENPLSRFIPFSSLVSPHDVITRGGDYLRVWRLDGVPFECADEFTITERHEAKCSLLRNLAGGQFAVWEHRLHRVVEDTLSEPAEPGFARDLARAYADSLCGQRMMSNELYLTLVYRPSGSRLGRALQSNRRSREEIAQSQAEALRVLEEKTALVERVLRAFDPRLLGIETRHGREFSEVVEFLHSPTHSVLARIEVHRPMIFRAESSQSRPTGAVVKQLDNAICGPRKAGPETLRM